MTEDIDVMTAAPLKVTLSDGTQLEIGLIELGSLPELERWVRDVPHRRARQLLETYGNTLTLEERREIRAQAAKEEKENYSSFLEGKGLEALESIEGLSEILWMCAKRSFQGTRAEFESRVDMKILEQVGQILERSIGGKGESDGPKQEGEKVPQTGKGSSQS